MAKVKLKKGAVDQKQVATVMREFMAGKLRDSHGEKVTDPEQAKAIAMSEGRSAHSRGKKLRVWKGRKRMRPIKKED